MIKKLQYFIGAGTDPHRNLAIEEYLTDTVPEDTCILYLWQNRHTVVIGRNQNAWAECRTTELERDSGTLARRLSGGGAVYHDMGNLNFTFSLREADYDLRRQQSVIVEACRLLGIPAEISGRNDILTNGCKFSGNSFYNHAGCAFHNGTLLLSVDMANLGKYLTPSKVKLESKGVASVRSRVINLTELKPDLTIDSMATAMVKAFETVYDLEASIRFSDVLLAQQRAEIAHIRSFNAYARAVGLSGDQVDRGSKVSRMAFFLLAERAEKARCLAPRQVCGKIGVDLRVAQFLAQKALQHLDGIRRLRSHAAGIPLRPWERKLSALRAHLFRRRIWILRRRNALPQCAAGVVVIDGRIFLLDHILLPLPEQFSPHSMPVRACCSAIP